MRVSNQRDQWAEHLRDEAKERLSQQRSAGDTHSPVDGPLPYSADDLELAVRTERERCAAIADGWASEAELRRAFAELTQWELKAASEAAHAIGFSIRGERRG